MNRWIKFFSIVIFVLIIFALTSVYAVNHQRETAEKFFKAFKENNYSLLEEDLTDLMKKVFNKENFIKLRKGLISVYGDLKSYRFIKEEDKGKYKNYYYEVKFEKKELTFIITMENNKIAGIHFKSPFSITALYPLVGGLIGLILIFLLLRKFMWRDFVIGAALLFITLLIQPFIQRVLTFKNPLILSLWIGGVAGVFQETLKYYFSRNKKLDSALYVGSGFGFGESLFVFLSAFSGGTVSFLSMVERFLAFFFHTGTTGLFSYAEKRGWGVKSLIYMIILHTIIDFFATYWNINPEKTYLIYAIYGIMSLFSLVILLKLIPMVKKEVQN